MELYTHIGYTIHSHTYTARYPVGWATYQTTDNSVYTYTQPGRTEVTATYTYTWWYNPDEEYYLESSTISFSNWKNEIDPHHYDSM